MTQENIPPIFCSACGQKNEGGANFCAKCGKQIISTVTDQPPPPTSTPPAAPGPERSEQKSSGIVTALAVVGFVFGLIGMLGSFVPLIGIFAIRICVGAAVISGISVVIALAQDAKRSFSIAALTISLIGVAMIYVQIGKLQSATETVKKFTEELQTKQPRQIQKQHAQPMENERQQVSRIDKIPPGDERIVIPDMVKSKWKAVKIEVEYREKNKKKQFTVPLNSEFVLPESDVIFKVGNFLPHFVMGAGGISSATDNPENPAVQVEVFQGGNSIYHGWIFSKSPDVHPFQTDKYRLALLEGIREGGQSSSKLALLGFEIGVSTVDDVRRGLPPPIRMLLTIIGISMVNQMNTVRGQWLLYLVKSGEKLV